jgi:transposase
MLGVLTWENAVMGRHFRKADSADQGYLLPPDARAWLPPRHLAWALLDVAAGLDLAGFGARYRVDGQGARPYDPAMMVTLVMYCYCKGIRSSRGIELATFDDVGARVICANRHPDHATVARFAGRHEQELKGLLAGSVAACAREGLVSVDVVAGDGTKVKASASMAANVTAAELDEQVTALEEVIAGETALWVEQHLAADAAEAAAGSGTQRHDAGPGGPGAGTGRQQTAHALARRRAAKQRLEADAAIRAEQAGGRLRARAGRLAERAAAKEEHAGRLFAVAQAKAAAYAARAAACPPGKKPPGKAPGAPGGNRDVRRVRAAAARLREKEAAARAGAAAAGPGKQLKVNLTDPGSRVMPLKKGGFDQLYNLQVMAVQRQVIVAIGTHDNPGDTGALHPLLAKARAVLAAAGITSPIGKALWDSGYASDANFTAGCDAELYVALTRESRQAGRGTEGYAPAEMMESWRQMAARLDTPQGKALYKQRAGIIEPVFAQLFARLGRHLNYRGDKTDLELHLWAASHNLLKAIGARQRAAVPATA